MKTLIDAALQHGSYISNNEGFISVLEGVEEQIQQVTSTDPARAVSLYETFLAGCRMKADDLDDSDNDFGMFCQQLICGWISARQAANADSADTVEKLIARMDDDPYGFYTDIEREAVKILNSEGLLAFEQLAQARFNEGGVLPWLDVLRAIYSQRRDADRYIELCNASSTSAQDCEAIAAMLQERGELVKALAWVERGQSELKEERFSILKGRLADIRRRLLNGLGRRDEALDSAWADYQASPDRLTYRELFE